MTTNQALTPLIIRAKFRQLLKSWFRIDQIALNPPQSIRDEDRPPSNLIEQPASFDTTSVQDITNGGEIVNRMNFGYQVVFRHPSHWKYSDIPRGDAEDLLSVLLAKINADYNCIHPEILEIQASGSVLIQEIEKSDWFLVFDLKISLKYPVFLPVVPTKTIFSN
jgi:hypothetical protein